MDSLFSFIDSLVASPYDQDWCGMLSVNAFLVGIGELEPGNDSVTHLEILKNGLHGQEWFVLLTSNASIHGSLRTPGMDQA